ncbi:ABC-type multidrug transport system, ATPase and permease component [Butyrivibrio fibrisolvens DSM 3071]|uniref:ABC-type multidrug transport system, ATPase and permease component n=1 Tax=Butyrivibrio fibrisolvens DSM 3071 TaxID=1121131 RepID=A0A1M5XVU9_BUTFI|nr:ABC transporter ATP-binding protein [Butyrivibrio fibrisolvens]SHI03957.1 ABC-type multidrug transport system, ATPase and permease component [Butyrivibrio fibrisolvens DSM 3071]
MRKIWNELMVLLSKKQKHQMVGIIILMLIGGILESLGIALISPIMTVVMDPEAIEKKWYLRIVYHGLHISDVTKFAALILGALIAVFVIKNIFLFFMNKVQLRFVFTNQFETSQRMMVNFINRPYEYYLNADTSVVQRMITSDVINMYGLILAVLQLISEFIVFTCIIVILLIQDTVMTVFIAAVLVLTLLAIRKFIKPVMKRSGEENQNFYSGLFKWISEAVVGIKEIKIASKEGYFVDEYSKCGDGYVQAVQRYNLFTATPRLLIETVSIAAMVGYIIVMVLNGVSMSDIVPQLGVLVGAASRLLPSANRINNYQTSIAYFEPFLDNVMNNLSNEIHDTSIKYDPTAYKRSMEASKLPVEKEIKLEGIKYHYPNSENYVLNNADMTIPVGKSVGIVGTTGAGKTTIVDVMLGLLQIEGGKVTADGVDVQTNYQGWLKNVGYIPQTIFMIDSTIRKNVAFGIKDEDIDDDKVWQALKEAQLDTYVRNLPEGLDTAIGERGIRLSGGQRQRIGIARALFENPEVLVLDEATSALDGETEKAVMDSINSLHGRKTLIIIAHRLQTIEKCDMVYRIENGKAIKER